MNNFMPKGIKGFQKGHCVPDELRKKISHLKCGVPLSEEHKRKISASNSGKIMSEEAKKKTGLANSILLKGRKLTEEHKKNISNGNKGRICSEETRRKIGLANKGEKSSNWKGGVTPIHKKIRKSIDFRIWRESVFARDNWTCVQCGSRGGILHPDHIKPFSLYPDLRFVVLNGRTLCAECHRKTDTYGWKISNVLVRDRKKVG